MYLPIVGLLFLCFASSEAVVEYTNFAFLGFGVRLEYPPNSDDNWVKSGMDSFDVVVGGVFPNGSAYHNDYFTGDDGYKFPEKDEKQDWTQGSAEEDNGFTTLEYERQRNTSDKHDNEIMPGYMFLVWAYHNSSDVFQDASNKHTASGLSHRLQLIPKPKGKYERETAPPPGQTAGASCMMIGNLFLALLAAIFLY